MLSMAGFLVGVLALAQDAPTVTIDRTAPVAEHLLEIQHATGGRLKSLLERAPRPVLLRVKDASFFQALDALCRADGSITYFGSKYSGPEGLVEIQSEPWVEYPVAYSGPYRVMITELTQTSQRSSLGERRWARAHLVLFAPPWISVGSESGAKADFVLQEARDAAGNDLVPPLEERDPVQRVSTNYVGVGTATPSNSASKGIPLRSFDLDRGLTLLRGHVALTIADGIEASVAPKEGESVQTAAGRLSVDRVTEHQKTGDGIVWRIQLTLTPASAGSPLRMLLENRVKQGEGEWRELDLPKNGMIFEAIIGPSPHLPPSLIFRARKGVRAVDVPFEFRNVSFKKG
jgi:hypothetical protein